MLDSRVVIIAVVLTTVIKSTITGQSPLVGILGMVTHTYTFTDNFRLVKGSNDSEVVEVLNNTAMKWLRVCTDTWDSGVLSAVCGSLNLSMSKCCIAHTHHCCVYLIGLENSSNCSLEEEIQTCVGLNCTDVLSLENCTIEEVRTMASCADAEIKCEGNFIVFEGVIIETISTVIVLLSKDTLTFSW